ncbi:MFS general substrate transporter [Dothidotthia symphoricarpi CBS 119687]|uniref:MFS general substrate transporter n=1 Tax=Dothidotthia symphoricarpi CBS 119687 TaxID=1392245 RepID=A0A6A6A0K0_9PLEO|nr:MFS general substrate transporter [Dothidotthia symphoricarpi CBS 119687]KAF2125340.1 MFS general substrate transporter [Dothidotthia symphoricarpi CBS 119687]
MYMSFFLVALDRLIIATAIPTITAEFDSIQDIGWYGSAYMLTAACFFPIFGRVYQLYLTKHVFLVSIIIFETGSALCGGAPNSTAFIVGRAIAGLGSAGIFSGATLIILPLVPLRKRPIFTSLFGLAFGVSSVLGPIVGGALTDSVSWRWCFYINLPVGGFSFIVVFLLLKVESPKRTKLSLLSQFQRLDPVGASFFMPSMVCLVLALQWGGSTDAWDAPKIIGLLVTFAVLFVAFIIVEVMMPETAMAPTRIVFNRSVAGSMSFMFFVSGSMMSAIYYLTIWFQTVKGSSATHAGIHTLPLLLSMIIFGIVAAVFTQKVGYYVPAMLVSPVLSAIGAGLLSTLSPDSNHSRWMGYQVLYGIGLGCGMQTSTLVVQTVLPRGDVPIGMALMFFMQQLGGAIFIAVGQNIFASELVDRLSGVAGLDTAKIINSGATDLHKIVPLSQIGTVIDAYNYALTRVFILAAALSACMIIGALAVEWRSIKGAKGGTAKGTEINVEEGNVEAKV